MTKGPGVDVDGLDAMSETPIGKLVAEEVSVMGERELSLLDGSGLKGDPESMLKLNAGQIRTLQQDDPTLSLVRKKVVQDRDLSDLANGMYFVKGGLMYRRWVNTVQGGQKVDQLVVPQFYRAGLLSIAHAIPLAGHMGIEKSRERLLAHFFWPGIYEDVRNFCNTCPECQKATGKGVSEWWFNAVSATEAIFTARTC